MGEKKNNVMLIGYYDYYSMKTHYLLQSMYYQYLKANENRSRWMIPGTISYIVKTLALQKNSNFYFRRHLVRFYTKARMNLWTRKHVRFLYQRESYLLFL
jgi:hypothetical protein